MILQVRLELSEPNALFPADKCHAPATARSGATRRPGLLKDSYLSPQLLGRIYVTALQWVSEHAATMGSVELPLGAVQTGEVQSSMYAREGSPRTLPRVRDNPLALCCLPFDAIAPSRLRLIRP
ncbi:hypothetical protein J6590_011492 [Homalodisca vitripennis]|nr:hypothetical protein J6590_011492 [Homalodisca vitripennis]